VLWALGIWIAWEGASEIAATRELIDTLCTEAHNYRCPSFEQTSWLFANFSIVSAIAVPIGIGKFFWKCDEK
jgi:hypothetical protein